MLIALDSLGMAAKMTTEELIESIDMDLSDEDKKFIVFICLLNNRSRIPQSLPGIWTELERLYGSPKAAHLLQFALSQVISESKVYELNEPYRNDPSLDRWWLKNKQMGKAGLRACITRLIREDHVPAEKFDSLKEAIVLKKILEKGTTYEKNDLK